MIKTFKSNQESNDFEQNTVQVFKQTYYPCRGDHNKQLRTVWFSLEWTNKHRWIRLRLKRYATFRVWASSSRFVLHHRNVIILIFSGSVRVCVAKCGSRVVEMIVGDAGGEEKEYKHSWQWTQPNYHLPVRAWIPRASQPAHVIYWRRHILGLVSCQ